MEKKKSILEEAIEFLKEKGVQVDHLLKREISNRIPAEPDWPVTGQEVLERANKNGKVGIPSFVFFSQRDQKKVYAEIILRNLAYILNNGEEMGVSMRAWKIEPTRLTKELSLECINSPICHHNKNHLWFEKENAARFALKHFSGWWAIYYGVDI